MLENSLTTRRSFIRALEAVALVPLVSIGLSNWDKHRTWHEINSDQAKLPKQELANLTKINDLVAAQSEFCSALESLNSAYRDEYHKSRLVPTVTIVNKKPVTTLRTEYYWDEPSHIPDHSVIENWTKAAGIDFNSFSYISNNPLIDVNLIHRIAIEAKEGSQTKQKILTGMIYGTIAAKTLFYEELIAKFSSSQNDSSFQEEITEISNPKETKRRDILKIGAAITGALVAGAITRKTDKGLSEGEDRLKSKINQADALVRSTNPADAITNYLGNSLSDLLTSVEQQSQQIYAAAYTGVRESKVQVAFQDMLAKAEIYKQALKQVGFESLNLEISASDPSAFETLGYLSSCATVTKQLANASNSESRRAAWAIALEGLGVAGAMAALIVPGEILIRKIDDSQ